MMEFDQAGAKMAQFDREEAARKSKVQAMMSKVRSKLGL